MVTKWKIYYEDDSVFTSEDGNPWDAPPYGVLAIWQNSENPQLVSQDYFLWRSDYGSWIEVQLDGLIDHLAHHAKDVQACLVGRAVPVSVFGHVLNKLRNDLTG